MGSIHLHDCSDFPGIEKHLLNSLPLVRSYDSIAGLAPGIRPHPLS